MRRLNFVCVFIITTCFNLVLTAEDLPEEYHEQNVKERAVGRSYSLTTCDYRTQIGYTCLSCTRALHCYVGNVAILVDCYGPFSYCRNGRCSRFQGEKCGDDKATTLGPFNSTIETGAASVDASPTTKMVTDVTESVAASVTESVTATVTESVTETVISTIDEKSTTKSDTTAVTSNDSKATTASEASTTVAVDISSNVV